MRLSKLVIFDLDGTLFRTETVDVEALNRALEKNGYSSRSKEEILGLIGLKLNEICKVLLGTDNDRVIEKFRADVVKFEDEIIMKSGKLYPGVESFLQRLKNCNFKLCICSNGNKEYVTSIAQKFDMYSIFDRIWYDIEGISKIEAVRLIKKEFGADGFIMVGDRACDIEAARENGGIAIGVTYGFGCREELEGADYIASSIEEVENIIMELYRDCTVSR